MDAGPAVFKTAGGCAAVHGHCVEQRREASHGGLLLIGIAASDLIQSVLKGRSGVACVKMESVA
jgi:hypothetical protein